MMPKERKVIGCKWVFKKKRNRDHRARLVAQGFSQVPGVDFSENFAPVIDDTSFRIVLSLIQKWGCKAFALDVETAFLHGSLEEEIYMRIPEGYDPEELRGEKRVLILSLVQAARQWWKRFNSEIVKLGFQSNHVDPCLCFKENERGRVFITLYVDDFIIDGEECLIKDTITSLQEVFKVKVQGTLEDYLGCEVVKEEEGFWIGQRRIIEDLIGKFKVFLPGSVYGTPSLH
jgi:hypothetical protein